MKLALTAPLRAGKSEAAKISLVIIRIKGLTECQTSFLKSKMKQLNTLETN